MFTGHSVPLDQPKHIFDLISKFTHHGNFF